MTTEDRAIAQKLNGLTLDAPTPQNTPLPGAPINAGLSRPTVPDIPEGEGEEELTRKPFGEAMDMEDGDSYLDSLPYAVKRRVEGLKGVQAEYSKLEREYKRELLELDKKYLRLYTPLFERRQAILTGTVEPSDAEVESGEQQSLKDDPESTPFSALEDNGENADVKGVPDFWLTALKNHIGIGELVTVRDEEALKHLTDIRFEYLEGPSPGYQILFSFTPNKFFTNEVLTKTYHYQDEVGYAGDYIYDHAIGTKINWKDDYDLTQEVEVRKQRNKNTNRIRVIRRSRPTASFFNFFTPPVPPAPDALEAGDIDGNDLQEIEENLELDYQIGEDLKEKVIPRAIDYFTGKALEYDIDDIDDEDHDEDDEEGYDEDEEEY